MSYRRASICRISNSELPIPTKPCLPRHAWSLSDQFFYILYSWVPRLLSSGYAAGLTRAIHVGTSTCVLLCEREISQRAIERSNT